MSRRIPPLLRTLVLSAVAAVGLAGCVAYPASPGYGWRGPAPRYAFVGPHPGWGHHGGGWGGGWSRHGGGWGGGWGHHHRRW